MIDSHNQAIALFQAQSQQGQDPDLKAWATQTLPNLQAHLQMVNQMLADIAVAKVVRTLPVTEPFDYAQDKLRRSGHFDYAQ